MPNMNEIAKGKDIGKSFKHSYIWTTCEVCGTERWVRLGRNKRPEFSRCLSCANKSTAAKTKGRFLREKNVRWKGGRKTELDGYVGISLAVDDFFAPMLNKGGYVQEHRLVMAKHLGRILHSWEVVHHKNGIKDDNRLVNLELSTRNGHLNIHTRGYSDGFKNGLFDGHYAKINQLETRILNLEAEVTLLRAELSKADMMFTQRGMRALPGMGQQ